MKKVLILQMRPEDEAADSEFEAILNVGQIKQEDTIRYRLEQNRAFNYNLEHYSAIIAGGSPFDVSSPPHKKSEAQQRVERFYQTLFDKVFECDFPFLGMCSGNGLLGQYCRTPISGKFAEPVGSVTVFKTKEALSEPLLEGLPQQFLAFVGHKEACDEVPKGATLLLSSSTCPVQMFRIKNNIFATQFHPEADVDEFILRIKAYQHFGYFHPDQADELIKAIQNTKTPHAHEVLRRFVKMYHQA